jgi:hypothetical protein
MRGLAQSFAYDSVLADTHEEYFGFAPRQAIGLSLVLSIASPVIISYMVKVLVGLRSEPNAGEQSIGLPDRSGEDRIFEFKS